MPKYSIPTNKREQALFESGCILVAGCDEAGAGCWAGPVFAGAVIFSQETLNNPPWPQGLVRDSKTLSAKQRQEAAVLIKETALAWSVGEVEPKTIDRINIKQACEVAMIRAIGGLKPHPDHVLIDFRQIDELPIPNTGITKGDSVSLSIAAASIIAKTERDALLTRLDTEYPGYGFAGHKGYGTAVHRAALQKLGPCPIHRLSYKPVKALA